MFRLYVSPLAAALLALGLGVPSPAAAQEPSDAPVAKTAPAAKSEPAAKVAPVVKTAPEVKPGEEPPPRLPRPEEIPECRQAIEKYKAKDVEGCFKLLEAAAAKRPELPPAKVMLAALLANQREIPAARALLERAAAERPDHPEVFRHFAELALMEGRLTDAEVLYDRALALTASNQKWPTSLRRAWLHAAKTGLATVEETRRSWDAAWRHLDFVFQMDKTNHGIRWRLARAMFLSHPEKADDALVQLRQCHEADPRMEPAELALGGMWMQLEGTMKSAALEKSEALVREAVRKYPKDVRTHAGLTAMLIRQGRVEEAEAALAPARELQPDSTDLRVFGALLARHRQQYEKAEELLQPALVKEPSNYSVSNQLALTLIEQDDPVKRRRGLELSKINAKLHPSNAETATTYGWALSRNGEAEEADKVLTSVVNVGQASSDCAYFLAAMAAERKETERARKLCESALAAPGTFVHRGACKELLAKLGSAK